MIELADINNKNNKPMDVKTFWEYWEKDKDRVTKKCYFWLNNNHHEAEDTASEIALKIANKILEQDIIVKDIKSWVNKIAFNACIDAHRKKYRFDTSYDDLESDDISFIDEQSYVKPLDETIYIEECISKISKLIESFPESIKTSVKLRFIDDMDYESISSYLNATPSTIRKRIQIGRDKIKQSFTGYYN